MPPANFLNPVVFNFEILYTAIIFFFCILTYIKTGDAYKLTKHKGIKYFRDAFLLFGLAYITRFFSALFMFSKVVFRIPIPGRTIFPFSLMIMSYLSTISIIYLLLSSMWKSIKNDSFIIAAHATAFLLSIGTFLSRSHSILLYTQLFLLIVLLIQSIIINEKKKKLKQINVLYLLILIFWLLNIWMITPRHFFTVELKIAFQFISLGVFATIYYKVMKWLK